MSSPDDRRMLVVYTSGSTSIYVDYSTHFKRWRVWVRDGADEAMTTFDDEREAQEWYEMAVKILGAA